MANTTDVFQGQCILKQNGVTAIVGFATTATDNKIDLFVTGNTTGGIFGAQVTLTDVATGVWQVQYISDAAGTEATPFSHV